MTIAQLLMWCNWAKIHLVANEIFFIVLKNLAQKICVSLACAFYY